MYNKNYVMSSSDLFWKGHFYEKQPSVLDQSFLKTGSSDNPKLNQWLPGDDE